MRRIYRDAWDGFLILAMGCLLLWAGCVAKGADDFSDRLSVARQ